MSYNRGLWSFMISLTLINSLPTSISSTKFLCISVNFKQNQHYLGWIFFLLQNPSVLSSLFYHFIFPLSLLLIRDPAISLNHIILPLHDNDHPSIKTENSVGFHEVTISSTVHSLKQCRRTSSFFFQVLYLKYKQYIFPSCNQFGIRFRGCPKYWFQFRQKLVEIFK